MAFEADSPHVQEWVISHNIKSNILTNVAPSRYNLAIIKYQSHKTFKYTGTIAAN